MILRALQPILLTLAAVLLALALRGVAEGWSETALAIVGELPWLVSLATAVLAMLFSQGRLMFAALALALAGFAVGFSAHPGLVFAVALLLPVNLAFFALLPEQPVFSRHSYGRVLVLAIQAVIVWRWLHVDADGLATALSRPLMGESGPVLGILPQWSILGALLGGGALLVLLVLRGRATEQGLLAAFAVSTLGLALAEAVPVFMLAAATALAASILLHSWELAFRDELTQLPGRRALNLRLRGLGERYALAMVDVDHFKKFNDTYGHEAGDQVLRMVGEQLQTVRGAKAYRYGGEEFTLVFGNQDVPSATGELKALCERIADYPFRLRGDREDGGGGHDGKVVKVTVSIGVAGPREAGVEPELVMERADEALYKAKRGGRNRVQAARV